MASDEQGKGRRADPFLQDEETAPLTSEEVARLRSGTEVFAELGMPAPRGRGRPRKAQCKQQVTLRLDPDIVERFRASGKGWQTRMNDALRQWLAEHPLPKERSDG